MKSFFSNNFVHFFIGLLYTFAFSLFCTKEPDLIWLVMCNSIISYMAFYVILRHLMEVPVKLMNAAYYAAGAAVSIIGFLIFV